MKQLRILTGLHAGARLKLERRQSTLGSALDADIQVSDWSQAMVLLSNDEGQDMMRLTGLDTAINGTNEIQLVDFVPHRFGEVVLCIGPHNDQAWPGDVELFSRLLAPVDETAPIARTRRFGVGVAAIAGGIVCVVLISASGALTMQRADGAVPRVPQPSLQARVSNALYTVGIKELAIRDVGDKVVVEGLVAATSDVARVRAALRPFEPASVIHRYAAASELSQSITDALANPKLHVRYDGHGVFVVEGAAEDIERLHSDAGRIAADLGAVIRRIDVAAGELPPPQRVHVDAMLVSGGMRYVQTRDGTKHLILSAVDGPDVESDVPLH